MVTAIPAARLAVFAHLCVLGSYSCSTGSDGTVQGILGRVVSLSCMSISCGSLHWRNDSMGETSPFIEASIRRTWFPFDRGSYKLAISRVSAYDVGSYSCWCNENNGAARRICSDSLELIYQAKVLVNKASKLYNISRTDSFPKVTINANLTDRLRIKCPEGAVSSTTCHNALLKDSAQFTYNFKVTLDHHGCIITCQVKNNTDVVCSIKFTINVSRSETSTHYSTASTTVLAVSPTVNETAFTTLSSENITLVPAYTTTKVDDKKDNNINSVTGKPVSFSVIIGVCILVFIAFLVTFVVSFYICLLRSKSRSQSSQNVNVVNPLTNANIPIGPTYATVNKPSNVFLKEDVRLVGPEIISTDGFYSEVGGAGQEESTNHQSNSGKAGTSITNDYYSEVNASDVKLKKMENGQETDTTLYSEVSKEENQPRQNECTSSQQSSTDDPSVSDVPIYHILEEPARSENDTEGNVSTSQDLYAVVDTDT